MTSITLAPVNIVHIAYTTLAVFSIFLVWGRKQCFGLGMLLAAHALQEMFNPLEELDVTRHYHLVTPAIQLAFGPLYFIFAKNLIDGDLNIRRHLIHLLPAVIALAFTAWWPAELMIAFVIFAFYCFHIFKLLHRYHLVLRNTVSDTEPHSLGWLIRTMAVILVIESIDFIRLNLQLRLDDDILSPWYLVSALISFFCTAYLVLKAVRQPAAYASVAAALKALADSHSVQKKIDLDLARKLFLDIDRHVRETLAYRRQKYSLRHLADETGFTEQDVSWAINHGGDKSFSDFVNDLRIVDIEKALSSSMNGQSILEIALDAGFNSKSSFNALFKRSTGLTPSQYVKQKARPGAA
jgi:AraC-like DNA-binding protein